MASLFALFPSTAIVLLLLDAATADPNTCQPRSEHPFMPIYHIIGNVRTRQVACMQQTLCASAEPRLNFRPFNHLAAAPPTLRI